ncbi:MAG: hypothetical protein ABL890_02845 [Candidatus Peribacteraceae bacterium]
MTYVHSDVGSGIQQTFIPDRPKPKNHQEFIDDVTLLGKIAPAIKIPGARGKIQVIVDLDELRRLEVEHLHLLEQRAFDGYVPSQVLVNLFNIREFAPHWGADFIKTNRIRIQSLLKAKVPPFRTKLPSKYRQEQDTRAWRQFPLDDFLIEFGADDYLSHAAARGMKRNNDRIHYKGLEATGSKSVLKFCKRAFRNGKIDPILVEHSIRHANENFNYSQHQAFTDAEDRSRQQFTEVAAHLEQTLGQLAPPDRKMVPIERARWDWHSFYRLIIECPTWYLDCSDDDRIFVAQYYSNLQQLPEDADMEKLKRAYRNCSLIDPNLPSPKDIAHTSKMQKNKVSENRELDSIRERVSQGDFSTLKSKHFHNEEVRQMWEKALIQKIESLAEDYGLLCKLLFGIQLQILKVLGMSDTLDKDMYVRSTILDYLVDLLERIDDGKLKSLYAQYQLMCPHAFPLTQSGTDYHKTLRRRMKEVR